MRVRTTISIVNLYIIFFFHFELNYSILFKHLQKNIGNNLLPKSILHLSLILFYFYHETNFILRNDSYFKEPFFVNSRGLVFIFLVFHLPFFFHHLMG